MTRRKKIGLVLGGLLLAPPLAVLAVGASLPVAHEASHEVALAAKPAAVWKLISDRSGAPRWRQGVSGVVRLADREGKPVFSETSEHGTITYLVEEQTLNQRMVTRIVDNDTFGGRWVYELRATPKGCALRITELGEVYNPVARVFAKFVFGHDSTIKAYLRDLQAARS